MAGVLGAAIMDEVPRCGSPFQATCNNTAHVQLTCQLNMVNAMLELGSGATTRIHFPSALPPYTVSLI